MVLFEFTVKSEPYAEAEPPFAKKTPSVNRGCAGVEASAADAVKVLDTPPPAV